MYTKATDAFHKAVAEGKPQRILLIFNDAVFTNDDVDVSRGVEFKDYFNLEEDIAIGQAPSNEISFTLFNDDRLLNSYKFGDFLATLGVLVATTNYTQTDGVMVVTDDDGVKNTWTGFDKPPYVKRNGSAVSAQPSFAVRSLLGYDGKLYAFSEKGERVVYNSKTGANITGDEPKINSFMKNKAATYWKDRSFVYNKKTRRLDVYDSGVKETYEFVPLGWFVAERPKAPDVIAIDMNCNDLMIKFDKDMPSKGSLGLSYPTTFKNLLQKICSYEDVEYNAEDFINSSAKLTGEPEEFESATMREVIKWIAEAAGGIARINRDGQMIIDWIHKANQTLTMNDYETFDPYWYKTKQIRKLMNRGSDGSYDRYEGSSSGETYLIQDNPLLKGVG